MKRLRGGVESSRIIEEREGKREGLPSRLRMHFGALAAIAVFSGGVHEAKANNSVGNNNSIGNIDDVYQLPDLPQPTQTANIPTLDLEAGEYVMEANINNGGEVELNSTYKAIIDNNDKTFKILNRNTNAVVESYTASSNISTINPVVSLGNGYVAVNGGDNARLFNINDIGTPNFNFAELSTLMVGMPSHLVKHPQTGDVVGVTIFGGQFFSYGSGQFMANHPLQGEDVKAEQAFKNVGILDANGDTNTTFSMSSVMENGDIRFVYLDSNGNFQSWVNPESNEVVLPTKTPEILGLPEGSPFTVSFVEAELGKPLTFVVNDLPEGGQVVFDFDGELLDPTRLNESEFELIFNNDLVNSLSNRGFDGNVVVRIFDQNGVEVTDENGTAITASFESVIDIDVPEPNDIQIQDAKFVTDPITGTDVLQLEKDEKDFNGGKTEVVINVEASNDPSVVEANLAVTLVFSVDNLDSETDPTNLNTNQERQEWVNQVMSTSGTMISDVEYNASEGGSFALNLPEGKFISVNMNSDKLNTGFKIELFEVKSRETSSVEPVEPTEPETPVEPTEPTEPTEPETPVEPTEPTDPEQPIDGGGDVDPNDPSCAVPGGNGAPAEAPVTLLAAALGFLGLRRKGKKGEDKK